MNIKDMSQICQKCALRDACNTLGDDTKCGMSELSDRLLLVSQVQHWFVIKNPIRRFIYKIYKRKVKINTNKYKQVSGHDFIFDKKTYNDWNEKYKR